MKDKYLSLLDNLPDAFACFQTITDSKEDQADYLFLYVNNAFTEMSGLSKDSIAGKKISKVSLGVKELGFDWACVFSEVALTGNVVRFDCFYKPMNCQYEVTVYSDEPGCFAVVFHETGDRDGRKEIPALEDLQETHQSLFTVLNTIDAFIYVADMQTYEILFVNRWGENIYSNTIGKKCWNVIQGLQTGPCEFCTNDKLLDPSGRPTGVYRWEFRNIRNGRWYDCRDIALQWIDGRMVRLEIATDITEYKKMQEALKKDRNKLAVLLEGMLDTTAVWINTLDEKGNITYWNTAAEQISGYQAGEVIGHDRIWDWLYPHPEYRTKINAVTCNIINKGERVENFETEIRRKNGEYRTILWHSNCLNEDNKSIGSIAFGADITKRKQIENKLRVSEERYSLLVNNANEAILVVQNDLIKYINPIATKMFRRPQEEMVLTNYFEYVHPDDLDLVKKRYNNIISKGKVQNPYIYRIKLSDGRIMLISVNSVKINWEGRPAALALMTDITELRKMEEEIIKADKFESISLLAGGIAHDLNNYLATLLGNITLAKLYKNDYEKIHEKLESIEKAIHRANILSNQLFTFTKGGAPVKKKLFINNLIVDNVKFTLSGSNVNCQFFIDSNLHMAEIDEGQFSQVLNNIVINAVQAMPDGGMIKVAAENIMIKAKKQDYYVLLGEGPYLKISIMDEGVGIQEEYLLKIFDPFFTTKQNGNGLGLATSYSIIRNHGGHLSVESEIGKGTIFNIFLPACVHTDESVIKEEGLTYGTGKILLMDDEEDILRVTGEMLVTLGYGVSFSRNGREAIEIYLNALKKGQPFDLVIMDLTVPGGYGGKETIKELLKKDPNVRAIVYSGYTDDLIMDDYSQYGFKGAIKKPFLVSELSKLIFETIHQ